MATNGGLSRRQSPARKSVKDVDSKMKSLLVNALCASPSSVSVVVNNTSSDHHRNLRKFWGEEVNHDSIYSIYVKKITYTLNNCDSNTSGDERRDRDRDTDNEERDRKSPLSGIICGDRQKSHSASHTIWYDQQQTLQWETREMRTLKAATLDHIIKYILFLSSHQQHSSDALSNCSNSSLLEEERNNVAHAMHVLFCTYRAYHHPCELYSVLMSFYQNCCSKQFNFVINYWLDNYPEDFRALLVTNSSDETTGGEDSGANSGLFPSSSDSDISSSNSSSQESKTTTESSESTELRLIDKLLSEPNIDDTIYRKCLTIIETKVTESAQEILSTNQKSISHKSSSVLELDPRFIAQQLTAIDLENFLELKPYLLLNGSRSKSKLEQMIRNFNLLSRHVIITILRAHSPHIVTSHWIEVALQLRKIRNFNSLKAIIAGLTNEAIYRLKLSVWNKMNRASMSTFKWLSSIVDDVNNQTVLRHTQLMIEGTSKVSLEDESFGTIPYLGTFLTDITMINTRYSSYVHTKDNCKLINFDKCSKQYEILMQIQLLQKNIIAALTAIQQQTQQMSRCYLPIQQLQPPPHKLMKPTIPRVARIFRIWFQSSDIELITDKQCFELSLTLESSPNKKKS